MGLILLAAATAALIIHARRHPPRSTGSLDPYAAWLIRQAKPALHR